MDKVILKKDGIYVVMEYDYSFDFYNDILRVNPCYVMDNRSSEFSLWGGRVLVSQCDCNDFQFQFSIDGITICNFKYQKDFLFEEVYIELEEVASYLNQIENLGIDTFLENYKKSLQSLKSELIEMKTQLSRELVGNEETEKNNLLSQIQRIIVKIICILFTLSVHLNAGLENHQYSDAYESVVNLFAQ